MIATQERLTSDVRQNAESIRQLTLFVTNLLYAPQMMVPPPQMSGIAQIPHGIPQTRPQVMAPEGVRMTHPMMSHPQQVVRMPANPMMIPRPQIIPAATQAVPRAQVPIPAAGPATVPGHVPVPVQAPLAAPVTQPTVTQQPKVESNVEEKPSNPPKFVFKPKNEPVTAPPTQSAVGSFFSSTPARNNTKQFVFKSPQQADVENAKLEEAEKEDEENEGDAGPHFEPIVTLEVSHLYCLGDFGTFDPIFDFGNYLKSLN